MENRTDNQCYRKWKILNKINSKHQINKEKNFILNSIRNRKKIFKLKTRLPLKKLSLQRRTSSFKKKKLPITENKKAKRGRKKKDESGERKSEIKEGPIRRARKLIKNIELLK